MMDFDKLTNAQRLILVGQIGVLLGTMMISLGTLLSMNEPPNQPLFGATTGIGSGNLGTSNNTNSAQGYFF
jgi:hypothetical protein